MESEPVETIRGSLFLLKTDYDSSLPPFLYGTVGATASRVIVYGLLLCRALHCTALYCSYPIISSTTTPI